MAKGDAIIAAALRRLDGIDQNRAPLMILSEALRCDWVEARNALPCGGTSTRQGTGLLERRNLSRRERRKDRLVRRAKKLRNSVLL
jgi:hypothetical protein